MIDHEPTYQVSKRQNVVRSEKFQSLIGQRHFDLAVWALAPVFSGRNHG